jgi:hypothetical protein
VIPPDPPAAAPTLEEADASFDGVRDMFPIPGVEFTGFDTIDISGPGDTMAFEDEIFQSLRDLKGDATDEYFFGLFGPDFDPMIPAGESQVLGGSASHGEGLAWSTLHVLTVAHEMGHLMRKDGYHSPGADRGQPEPDNIDPHYPKYGMYPEGSIGQHGIDTGSPLNQIRDPKSYSDIMSYRSNRWISPYTSSLLSGAVLPPPQGIQGGDVALLKQPERRSVQTLFLSVDIRRNRSVQRLPSFHYPAPPRLASAHNAEFTVELADECRDTLVCGPLDGEPVGRACWPRRLYAQVPYPAGAKWLLVWEGERLLYEECLPAPPSLDLSCQVFSAGIELNWNSSPSEGVWYLVQRRDQLGKWRGLGQRTQETHTSISGSLLGSLDAVRVLATSGIATAMAMCEVAPQPSLRTFTLSARPQLRSGRRPGQSEISGWRALIHDETGRSLTGTDLLWFDDRGRMIVRGPVLQVQRIPDGVHEILLILRNRQSGRNIVSQRWKLRREGREYKLHSVDSQSQDQSYSY